MGLSVCLSSVLWKNGGSDPDAVWGGRSDGSMDEAGSLVRFGDRSTGRSNFGGKYGAPHCNQWGLFTIGNFHCAAERLLLGEFLELHACRRASRAGLALARGVASWPSNTALLPRDRGQTCSVSLHLLQHFVFLAASHRRRNS